MEKATRYRATYDLVLLLSEQPNLYKPYCGFGNLPVLTPSHQVDLPTGINAGIDVLHITYNHIITVIY